LCIDVFDDGVVSYADFITLLFAFFVVLYASAQVDKRKVGKLAMSIQVAFQQLGVFETSNTKVPLNNSEPVPFENVQAIENVERSGNVDRVVQPMKGILSPNLSNPEAKDVRSDIETALAPEIQKHVVAVTTTREGVVVSLREVGFYESGSPSLRASAEDAVDRLAGVLKKRNESLRIEGHTDNVPIHNKQFASNWELSTARASDLVRLLIDRHELSPNRLSAAGYAEFHPVAANNTADGRARNRRVDIVILNPPVLLPAAPGSPASAVANAPPAAAPRQN
jgi:chemotaxis protein MotB